MRVEFDPDKDAVNRDKHGISLADAWQLDLRQAVVVEDDRQHYGETRFRAYGFIDGRMHMLVFTVRDDALRVISFRKANQREEKQYDERRQTP